MSLERPNIQAEVSNNGKAAGNSVSDSDGYMGTLRKQDGTPLS